MSLYHTGAPVKRIHLDVLAPFVPSNAGDKYIPRLVCQFTKWREAYPLPDQRAESVAKAAVDNFILTDQGSNFVTMLLQSLSHQLGIART